MDSTTDSATDSTMAGATDSTMAGATEHGTPHNGAEPSKLTLVFLHASGESAREWDAIVQRLPEYDTRALDLPGHGALIERPGPARMRIEDYADAVRAELTRQQVSNVCLVGHSLGTAIALRLAVDYPSLVRRLVLVGAGARLRVLPAVLEQARTQQEAAAHVFDEAGFAPDHEAQRRQFQRARAPLAPGMLYRDLDACDHFDMMGEIGRIEQPALIITGELDRLTPPKFARFLYDHLADAHLIVVPNAGHYVIIEAPDTVTQAIHAWLRQ